MQRAYTDPYAQQQQGGQGQQGAYQTQPQQGYIRTSPPQQYSQIAPPRQRSPQGAGAYQQSAQAPAPGRQPSPQNQQQQRSYQPRPQQTQYAPQQRSNTYQQQPAQPAQSQQDYDHPTYYDEYSEKEPIVNAGRPYMDRNQSYNSSYNPNPRSHVVNFGYPPPQMQPSALQEKANRRKSVRHVELTQGNLVLDCPVPSQLLTGARLTQGEEFTHLRYTAATCDPNDFIAEKYTLRPYLMGRKTELFIVMTMYNEDDGLFVKTMSAVQKNIAHLCSRSKSKMWGPDGWKKVVVCIVSDGRNKIHPRTLKVLGLMGCYQEGIAKDSVAGKDVTAHIFEYTTQVCVDNTGSIKRGMVPVQILFCLKEKNAKKLNSHRWFFNAFAPQINPNVCILLDVGTKPTGTSLYHLWKAFDRDAGVGGACGEITAELGRGCSKLINPVVASQNFEYKMSNILDKPLESVFGYISVLPGAFSAYRYKALKNSGPNAGPLHSYFKGEAMHGAAAHQAGIFEANMYLAEDRILCFELVTKKNEAWRLKYVKSARAETDVPDNVPEFISQRRRWLNGSFFAAVYATWHFWRIWTSGQGFFRKCLLQFEFIYNFVNLIFNWTALANFYLAFFFLVNSATSIPAEDPFQGYGQDVFQILEKAYIAVLFTVVICSLGNRPQGSKWTYTLCIVIFAIIMACIAFTAFYTIYLAVPHTLDGWRHIKNILEQSAFRDIVISLAATYGLYFFASFLYLDPWHMFTSFIQYLFLLPSYVNILLVYAFANTHDVSWGTKGDNSASSLGGAKTTATKEGKQVVQVDIVTEQKDVNALFDATQRELSVPYVEAKSHRDVATKTSDSNANFRTKVLLFFFLTNAFIVLFFTSTFWNNYVANQEKGTTGSHLNYYMIGIFWSVAALSSVRFVGCVAYILGRMIWG